MAQKHSLKVEKRTVIGKKVKKLRREGILPGNVYGADFKSQAVQVPYSEFDPVFKEAGETGLIDLKLDSQTIPVLIHNIHTNFRSEVLHADFFKVNLKEKVKAMIPLEFVGTSKAELEKTGLLEKVMHEIEVDALPTDLPEKIEVDVSNLAQIDEQVIVSDLKLPSGVEILSDPAQVVVKVGELVTKEAQAELEAEAAAQEAARAEAAAAAGEEGAPPAEGAETTEGETPAEGAAPAEDKSKDAGGTAKGEPKGEEQKKEEPPKT